MAYLEQLCEHENQYFLANSRKKSSFVLDSVYSQETSDERIREVLLKGSREPELKKFHGTSLTARQWEVIRYRARGFTQAEVARRLATSRENVSIIEHRAWSKINAARATLAALRQMDTDNHVLIPSGTCVYESIGMIILRADILGVKLRCSSDDMLAELRSRCKGKIRGHHLVSAVIAEVRNDGRLSFD